MFLESPVSSFALMWNGVRLRTRREALGYSRAELEAITGIGERTIENHERPYGHKLATVPDSNQLLLYAKGLKTTAAYFLEEVDDPSPEILKEVLPRGAVDRVINTPFRASHNTEKMKKMTDEEILAALKRVHDKQILIDLEEEYLKELERRKHSSEK